MCSSTRSFVAVSSVVSFVERLESEKIARSRSGWVEQRSFGSSWAFFAVALASAQASVAAEAFESVLVFVAAVAF